MTDEERQQPDLHWITYWFRERNRSLTLKYISEYFEYLAKCIQYRKLRIDIESTFLQRFDGVFLIFKETLTRYPESISKQVDSVINGLSLGQLFAGISINEPRSRSSSSSIIEMIAEGVQSLSYLAKPTPSDPSEASERNLRDAKLALIRLSQIAMYASGLDEPDFDENEGLEDHYNPDLVDKAKILALLNVLASQARTIREPEVRSRLLKTLEKVEDEVRKSSPRWKRAIATFFILFGFLADLKTVEPAVYEPLYRTAQAIITAIHDDGRVEHHRRQSPTIPTGDDRPALPLPSAPRLGDEDEKENDF